MFYKKVFPKKIVIKQEKQNFLIPRKTKTFHNMLTHSPLNTIIHFLN